MQLGPQGFIRVASREQTGAHLDWLPDEAPTQPFGRHRWVSLVGLSSSVWQEPGTLLAQEVA